MSDQTSRLDDARQAINRLYRDEGADVAEIMESFETLTEDIEMYVSRLEKRAEREEEEDEEDVEGE